MESLKLNILHIKLFSSDSFPIELNTNTEFSKLNNGKFEEDMTYNFFRLNEIVEFAYERGILVIPEIDFPTNSEIVSKYFPNLTADCPTTSQYNHNFRSLNILNNDIYKLIEELIKQLSFVFQFEYFNFGNGVNFNFDCWRSVNNIIIKKKNRMKI
jgi:hexosaminidase